MFRRNLISALCATALLGGCGQGSGTSSFFGFSGGSSQNSDGSILTPPPNTITPPAFNGTVASLAIAPGELVTPPTPSLGTTPLLNEVVFIPADRLDAFVEIKPGTADRGPLTLRNQNGDVATVPSGTDLVVVHFVSNPSFLNPTSGSLTLLAGSTVLDYVAWGDQPDATLGGVGQVRAFGPGDALVRTPQSTRTGAGYWFYTANPTPGTPNPTPRVVAQFPLPGLIDVPGERLFSWYPLAGAVSYRLQISSDRDFNSLLVDQTLSKPAFLYTLPVGDYYWRVQAIFGAGELSNFTPPAHLQILASLDSLTSPRIQPKRVKLTVPLLKQRKDTHLLLLECLNADSGLPLAHTWNTPHEERRTINTPIDPACDFNCFMACTVMLNHFYGGNLSQDRLSYELFHDRPAGTVPKYSDGPERDFQFGDGVVDIKSNQAVSFALGAPGIHSSRLESRDSFWEIVKSEIDAGRPLILSTFGGAGAVSGHATVVVGYRDDSRTGRILILNNPWDPTEDYVGLNDIPGVGYDLGAVRLEIPNSINAVLLRLPETVTARNDEVSIATDTDGDGVCDFDEARFGTKADFKDSDNDCINDLQDISCTMFRPGLNGPPLTGTDYYSKLYFQAYLIANGGNPVLGFGAGLFQAFGLDLSQTTRDPDGDGLRAELDQNSDKGILPDFLEDDNRNGQFDAGETSPLVADDDSLQITGTVKVDQDSIGESNNPTGQIIRVTSHSTRNVKFSYDLRVQGQTIQGGVSIDDTNNTAFIDETLTGSIVRVTLDQAYDDRSWMSPVNLKEWFCDFGESGQEHDSLTFQLITEVTDAGGPIVGFKNIETDYFSDGTSHVFDRSNRARLSSFPPVFFSFLKGRAQSTQTDSGKTITVDLTAHH